MNLKASDINATAESPVAFNWDDVLFCLQLDVSGARCV